MHPTRRLNHQFRRHSHMTLPRALILAAACAAGCGATASPHRATSSTLPPTDASCAAPSKPTPSASESIEQTYRVAIAGAGDEEQELHDIAQQSLAILASPAFRANLLSLTNADNKVVRDVSATGTAFISYEELAKIAALKSSLVHKFRSHFVLHGTYFNTGNVLSGQCSLGTQTTPCQAYQFEDNRDNEIAATRVVTLGPDSVMESVIGRRLHDRWHGPSLERKSCAINTFSHELIHAFSASATITYLSNYFVDTITLNMPSKTEDYATATYLVGTVAQCTWLQNAGAIAADNGAIKACAAKFGVSSFNSDECK